MQNDTQNIIGVDVGSGSVRAGVFNLRGELLAHATREITLFRSAGNKVEQSSREIWQAVCYCIKTAVASAGVSPSSIAGIGFDATCSLVVIGDNDAPLAVGPSDLSLIHISFQGYRRVNKYPLQQRLRAAKPLLQAVLNVAFRIAGGQNIRLRHAKPQLAMRIVEAA